jgi:hypothetical protein
LLCSDAGGAWLAELAAQPLHSKRGVMAHAIDGKGDPVGLADQARQQRGMVMPPPVMAKQRTANSLQRRPHPVSAAGPPADVKDALGWMARGELCRIGGILAVKHGEFPLYGRMPHFGLAGAPLPQPASLGGLGGALLQALAPAGLASEAVLQVSHQMTKPCQRVIIVRFGRPLELLPC